MTTKQNSEIKRLQQWVTDLQSGCYINCVYCGHRYGPDPGTPVAMADVLKKHILKCPKHPMSTLLKAMKNIQEMAEEEIREGCDEDSIMWQIEADAAAALKAVLQ